MKLHARVGAGSIALLGLLGLMGLMAGCANGRLGTSVSAMPAQIYSPAERLMPGPGQELGATGEVRYCSKLDVIGGDARGAELRKSALDNIGKACGGDDKYHVIRELDSGVKTHYMGAGGLIQSTCPSTWVRAIYFKCSGAPAQAPTGAKGK